MEDICRELVQFMQLSTRLEVKLTATKNVLALTGSPEGRNFIVENKTLLEAILTLTNDENPLVVKDSYLSLVNLSTEERVSEIIMERYTILPEFVKVMCDPDSSYSDQVCMIMSNLTRTKFGSLQAVEFLSEDNYKMLRKFLDIFCNTKYNKKGGNLNYLALFLANLTQSPKAQLFFLDEGQNHIQRLLPFLHYNDSSIRRGGVASLIRNCCFNYESHNWLLGEKVELLSNLLLPLAGPEEFDEDEIEELPLDLQYLPSDKTREPDEDIRKIFIECVILLCADTPGRNYVKSKNTYLILRELHRWETENGREDMADECEKLIQILISEEPDEGNLLNCEIPEKYEKLFNSS